MTVSLEECKKCGRNVRIGMLILIVICLPTGFALGFIVGKKNLLTMNTPDYNFRLAINYATGSKEVLDTRIVEVFFNDDGKGELFTRENVTVIVQQMAIGGYYLGGNEIHVRRFDSTSIGHELCHLILNRYGVEDVKANEQICYSIQNNYDWEDYHAYEK